MNKLRLGDGGKTYPKLHRQLTEKLRLNPEEKSGLSTTASSPMNW